MSMVAEDETGNDNLVGNRLAIHRICHIVKIDGESTRAVCVKGICARFMDVKACGWICGGNAGRRRRVGAGLDKVDLRQTARAIKMGHGDSFALHDCAGGEKNLTRDSESVIAIQRGLGTAIVILGLSRTPQKEGRNRDGESRLEQK
jgi:hypothetical protein